MLSPYHLFFHFKAQRSSFGERSENLRVTDGYFSLEILVFDHDYEGKSSLSSNGLLQESLCILKLSQEPDFYNLG